MVTTTTAANPWKSQQISLSLTKKLLPYILYAILPIALLRFCLYPSLIPHSTVHDLSIFSPVTKTFPVKEKESGNGLVDTAKLGFKEKESENGLVGSANLASKDMENNVDKVSIPARIPSKDKKIDNNEVLHSSSSSSSPIKGKGNKNGVLQDIKSEGASTCDYTNGDWVQDKRGPLYNGTSCGTIKDGQNCLSHGRPDKGYLYWRWKPKECSLPRFDPQSFLRMMEGKHLTFIGDSMARNQLESLLCMLASISPPNLVYSNGDDNKFRRWHFPSHNVNVSVYWSPFLVKGLEKTNDGKLNYNKLYFDSVDQKWASDLDSIDMVVLSIGHWYLHPALYLDGDSVIGCHYVTEVNCTETEYFGLFGKAFNTTLKAIFERKGQQGKGIDVIVTTFSPHHFEGDWDKFGACPRTKPFMEGEKKLEGMDADMRKVEVEEVEKAKALLNADQNSLSNVRLAALDVTKLAMLRPDGHPGPYMYPDPFADGIKERVQNDCVHWCLPGPIDTWNEIMFDIMKRWRNTSMR